MPTERPNLFFFIPDSWRGEACGYAGNTVIKTPHLDALATEGMGFNRAFAQNPVCVPSRCSFMSGWYPHTRGHRTMHHMLSPAEPELLKNLKSAGYHVAWAGKNDMVRVEDEGQHCSERLTAPWPKALSAWLESSRPRGSRHEYTHYHGRVPAEAAGHHDEGLVDAALAFLDRRPPEPFCLVLTLSLPHCPFAVEDPWFSMHTRSNLPPLARRIHKERRPGIEEALRQRMGLDALEPEDLREILGTYYGMVSKCDSLLGRLVAGLKNHGLWDRTASFVFSDHGDYGGDFGLAEKTENTLQDCLVRVPFVARIPGLTPRPVSGALVELVDFPATVYGLLGLKAGHDHFGRSLLPLLRGETTTHREAVFAEGGSLPHEGSWAHNSFHLPEHPYWARCSLETERRDLHGKAVMVRTATHKYIWRLGETHELYDLLTDPLEEHNRLIPAAPGELESRPDDPALIPILQSLRSLMLEWMVRTADVVPRAQDSRFPHEGLPIELQRSDQQQDF
jgi:arylsulfatase A-like enzyme